MAVRSREPTAFLNCSEALVVTTRICLKLLLILTDLGYTDSTVGYDFLFSFPFFFLHN